MLPRRTDCLGSSQPSTLNDCPKAYLETYRERIHGLQAQDVMGAARRHFDSANSQIIVVGDRAQVAEQASLFGPVTEYDVQGNQVSRLNGRAANPVEATSERADLMAGVQILKPRTGGELSIARGFLFLIDFVASRSAQGTALAEEAAAGKAD